MNKDLTRDFPSVARAGGRIQGTTALLDGETWRSMRTAFRAFRLSSTARATSRTDRLLRLRLTPARWPGPHGSS